MIRILWPRPKPKPPGSAPLPPPIAKAPGTLPGPSDVPHVGPGGVLK